MGDTEITVYGATWCGDCKRAKQFLGEQRVHYHWVDVEQDAEGLAFVERSNGGKRIIPTIVFGDGSLLVEPSNAELAAKLGLQSRAKMAYYDLIVVGSGPTGLTAALYAAREGMDVLVIERSGVGGQAGVTERLDNFPGFPEGVGGAEFADRLARQARRFGVEILQAQEVTGLRAEMESRYITTSDGAEYGARAVLIATGSTYRRLGVPGEDELIGAGVHFCATCDGPFYKGREVAVVGGGNSAGEESVFLTRFVDKVTLLVRGDELSASKVVIDKINELPQIEVRYNTVIDELKGDGKLAAIVTRDRKSGAVAEITPAGLFVFIGLTPNVAWLPAEIARDQYGFIVTERTLETSVPGVFAAGDVRQGSTKQAASAAGEGATAALMIREYLKGV
ncbi:FAD-dependent oxidoreductase [Oscillochloris sp. ZM17-4]|uniref:FAD-dependent oxidoreductase n=1 Tax=Oscillochloris sp. ZM17-4 TaxID=2866714 RepID=UPI001C72F33E|nr:FAD-dependent oxidoreductase [Oscillochloris sp. ZM17-4]MBX0330884.1 FAD-dependent oxidoreductase [Oscillochloris sp. ZM17-4]